MSAWPSGDWATPAWVTSPAGVPSSTNIQRCISALNIVVRRFSASAGSGAGAPGAPGGPSRITICIPPPMPPRFCMSVHEVSPFRTCVRSIVAGPIRISSSRCIRSGAASTSAMVPSVSRCPIVAAERPFDAQALDLCELGAAERLAHLGQHFGGVIGGLLGGIHRQRHHAIQTGRPDAYEHCRRHCHPRFHACLLGHLTPPAAGPSGRSLLVCSF